MGEQEYVQTQHASVGFLRISLREKRDCIFKYIQNLKIFFNLTLFGLNYSINDLTYH
jgi:hypothetical protein